MKMATIWEGGGDAFLIIIKVRFLRLLCGRHSAGENLYENFLSGSKDLMLTIQPSSLNWIKPRDMIQGANLFWFWFACDQVPKGLGEKYFLRVTLDMVLFLKLFRFPLFQGWFIGNRCQVGSGSFSNLFCGQQKLWGNHLKLSPFFFGEIAISTTLVIESKHLNSSSKEMSK